MERNEFLKVCQKVSMLPDGVMHTKKWVRKNLKVTYEDNEYYPEYLEIRFKNGTPQNIAVIHELKANCRLCVPLELVEKLINESE